MTVSALFETSQFVVPMDEPVDARKVACPVCGAPGGRFCRLTGKRRSPRAERFTHEARRALARFAAGLADEPAPRLFEPK